MTGTVVLVIALVAAGLAVAGLLRLRSMSKQPVRAPAPVVAPPQPSDTAPREVPGALTGPEIFSKLYSLALGTGHDTGIPEGHGTVIKGAEEALHDAATQQRYSPRRPNMLPRLLSATSDESVSRRELSSIIARDPSLVGSLLKIANSSYYRITPEPVESVDRAVGLLGTDGIRSLITTALMQPIFRIGGGNFPRFAEIAWEHTYRSSSAAVPYNFLVEKSDPFAAELLSLVMGLAGIVVFRVVMDQYAADPSLQPHPAVIESLLEAHQARMARRIGATWELSEQTLSGLDGLSSTRSDYPSALGRSIHFGRTVGALAVLHINRVIDEATAKLSIPLTSMPEAQVDRMWTRVLPQEKA